MADNRLVKGFTNTNKYINPPVEIPKANNNPCADLSRPDARGRRAVRAIKESTSRSRYILKALAPPAMRAVPTKVCNRSISGMDPWIPLQKPTKVVNKTKEVSRGLVSFRKSEVLAQMGWVDGSETAPGLNLIHPLHSQGIQNI